VSTYLAYRVGHGPDAEDITSDAFERALRYRDSFDARRGDPAAWLIGIARRCIADAAVVRPLLVAEIPGSAAPGDVEEDGVRRVELAAALATLSEASASWSRCATART
jgi:DNA-directed RNA polymerase specialized sigma24 family protein